VVSLGISTDPLYRRRCLFQLKIPDLATVGPLLPLAPLALVPLAPLALVPLAPGALGPLAPLALVPLAPGELGPLAPLAPFKPLAPLALLAPLVAYTSCCSSNPIAVTNVIAEPMNNVIAFGCFVKSFN
jgi:hypothetical protein